MVLYIARGGPTGYQIHYLGGRYLIYLVSGWVTSYHSQIHTQPEIQEWFFDAQKDQEVARFFKGHTKQLLWRKIPTMFFPTQTTTWFPLVSSIHAMKHKLYISEEIIYHANHSQVKLNTEDITFASDTNITSITYNLQNYNFAFFCKNLRFSPQKKNSTNAGSPVWVLINITCRSDMRTSPQLRVHGSTGPNLWTPSDGSGNTLRQTKIEVRING